ncbi:hypothetical protein PISMIDRAFT_20616 [Pisolithus microcarpus 441]|uniref:Uncharacterized protein n=1 Tax=Pisolithus microcarpus 441 TaxID=765257 RepID=A0A0D0AGM3_9AGAM|nr:hypothetical protein PISMIDRAFT_20616 [Pisolithus microcarpus 441]
MDPSSSCADHLLALSASESSDTDEVNSSTARVYFGPVLSPGKKYIVQSTARQRTYESDALSTPLRRSPRLSPAASPHLQSLHGRARDDVENSPGGHRQDLSGISCEDPMLQDEPSSVLASKIMRAFDNPSPPPQRRVHTDIQYTPGRNSRFPLLDASAPPSPFRAINLFEKLNQLAEPLVEGPTASPTHPSSLVPENTTQAPHADALQPDLISFKSCSKSTLQNTVLECTHGVIEPHSPSTINVQTVPVECSIQGPSLTRSSAQEVSYITEEPPGVSGRQKDCDGEACASQSSSSEIPSLPIAGNGSTTAVVDSLGEGSVDDDKVVVTNPKSGSKRKLVVAGNHNKLCQHRLGSLSPQSEGLLTQLLSPSRQQQVPSALEREQEPIPFNPSTHRLTLTTSPTPPCSATAQEVSLKSGRCEDGVHRTPARRVPIYDALANATPSLQKAARRALLESQSRRIPNTGGPVFSRPENLSHSPAKRVPVAGCIPSPSRPITGSTMPIVLRARSASVEPHPTIPSSVRSRSVEPTPVSTRTCGDGTSKKPTFPPRTISRPTPPLPFPLVPQAKADPGSTYPIPEENETVDTTAPDAATRVSPVSSDKSHLRQRSVASRIPRMNAKPYARPQTNANNSKVTSVSKLGLQSVSIPKRRPYSEFLSLFAQKPILLTRPCSKGGYGGTHDSNTNEPSSSIGSEANTLKRKRAMEEGTPQPRFRSTGVHQITPGTFGGKRAVKSPNSLPELSGLVPSPQKPNTPILFRKVVDGMLSARYQSTKASVETRETSLPDSVPVSRQDSDSSVLRLPSETQESRPLPVTTSANREGDNLNTLLPHASAVKENDFDSQSSQRRSALKRSSRARKVPSDVHDVFNTTSRSDQPSRRPPTRAEASGFVGMSASALRALTSSNTTRNQQTVAILATEVIRKEGLRPESPAVKIRTILQKEKEEQDRQRMERAQRRARRSEEGSTGSDTEGPSEHAMHTPDGYGHDTNVDLTTTRHVRAPGDEEDYETPERLSPIKRPRFGEEDNDEQVRPTKQVKWCYGLGTTAFVDDVDPKPRFQRLDSHAKGCLAPSSKSIHLDTLGNIKDIDSRPPLQLVQEHVVIKKYMYDNDVEAEPAPTRMTRSKNKKPKG